MNTHDLPDLFSTINDPIGRSILASAATVNLPEKTTIFYQGDNCKNYLLVIKGKVKVFTRAENGREIILYRVNDGESCTLTTTCLLAGNNYPAEGVTETPIEALAISLAEFNKGIAQSPSFRQFVFNNYGKRLCAVITLVGEVSFGRIDVRLAKVLTNDDSSNTTLNITHQDLATELGTAREVISRQLKDFEHKGWLTLSRGKISIHALDKLISLANTPLV
jgi:CRP/FNR family transcriptional regulator